MARPIIGFVCEDIQKGAKFYKEFEALMAIIWRDETQRPIVYAEFGLPKGCKPEVVDLDDCDFVFNIQDLPDQPEMTPLDGDAKKLLESLRGQKEFNAQDIRKFHFLFQQMKPYMPPKEDKMNPNRKVNVIAGMGPIAGANFIQSLASELDHAHLDQKSTVQIYSNPQLPGKHIPFTLGKVWQAITHCIDYLLRFRKFVNNTEGVLVAPCNTFHTNIPFLETITKIKERILHIVKQVELRMFEKPNCATVAIMGTQRTVEKDLYESTFEGSGKAIFSLKNYPEQAALVQEGINLVKSGQAAKGGEMFQRVIEFIKANAPPDTPIILGCTEIVIGCRAANIQINPPLYDSADILAHATAQTVLISPEQNRDLYFSQTRDVKNMLAFCISRIMRYQLALARDGEESPEEMAPLIQFLQAKQGQENLTVVDYRATLEEIFKLSIACDHENSLSVILGEILQHELAESSEIFMQKDLEIFSQLLQEKMNEAQAQEEFHFPNRAL